MSEQFGVPSALASPGMIVRASVGLGEQDRILQFEGFLDRDCEQGEIDALCEKMIRAGNRAKAKTMLPVYRRQLRFQEGKLADNRGRVAGIDAKLAELKRLREEKALSLRVELDSALRLDQDRWDASGKRGEYQEPKGKFDRKRLDIAALEADQSKDASEAEQQLSILENEIKEGQRVIGEISDMIAECEALARHEDISGTE